MIGCHYHRVNNKGDNGKDDIDKRTCQERLYPVMITYSLHDVANELDIEKGDWQFHQLQKKIGNERNADSRCNMQHKPGADKLVCRLPEYKCYLGNQHYHNKSKIAIAYPVIDYGLGNKGKEEAYYTCRKHAKKSCAMNFL
jgi:hypothetical protein